QAAWPAMDSCGCCSSRCCDCSVGCKDQVRIACGKDVTVVDPCSGRSRIVYIADCGPCQKARQRPGKWCKLGSSALSAIYTPGTASNSCVSFNPFRAYSFFIDSWLKYRLGAAVHSSCCSMRTAPAKRISEARFGKIPTTSV